MLTPMLVQYLVGLCCLRRNPDAVDIILGDMVLDPAAGKERDVDITITLKESLDIIRAFKAYEVKDEGKPLDVSSVEQLCLKLLDMPSITHRAIVSTSGFTDGARNKAANHGIELYTLKPWTRPIKEEFSHFEKMGMPEESIHFSKNLLFWIDHKIKLTIPNTPPTEIKSTDLIYAHSGKQHPKYKTFAEFRDYILLYSTKILFQREPAISELKTFALQRDYTSPFSCSQSWPYTHSLNITNAKIYFKIAKSIIQVKEVTITGHLQWQNKQETPQYYIMRKVPTGEAFAGAMIALGQNEGEMFTLTISPNSNVIGWNNIQLEDKHKNMIRKLKLDIPPMQDGES